MLVEIMIKLNCLISDRVLMENQEGLTQQQTSKQFKMVGMQALREGK
jgi:hypothetical protein